MIVFQFYAEIPIKTLIQGNVSVEAIVLSSQRFIVLKLSCGKRCFKISLIIMHDLAEIWSYIIDVKFR